MQTISSEPLDALLAVHLKPVNTGKARDSFTNPEHAFMRYVYVSDRLSSNDFNLGFGLRRHGEVRNASTIYWKLRLKEALIETDLIAFGSSIDAYLPNELQNIPELWKRMTVVVDAEMELVENIGRNRLLGSAWDQYEDPKNNRIVFGQQLPESLWKGDLLETPLWTPTTKAPPGQNDMPLEASAVDASYPDHRPLTLSVLGVMNEVVAENGEAEYGDTKLEFGRDPTTHRLLVCDEIGSFDSSRIYPREESKQWLRGQPGIGCDKDIVRVEMRRLGIKKYKPSSTDDQEAVKKLLPEDVFIRMVEGKSLESFALTAGEELEDFQFAILGIPQEYLAI